MTMLPLLAAFAALGQATPPPPPTDVATGASAQRLVRWVRSPVLCAPPGEALKAEAVVLPVDPQRSLSWSVADQRRSITLEFRIDASGRPLGIRREGTGYTPDAGDVVPAFAATRFAPGAERPRCTVTFTASVSPIEAAPVEDVMAYSVFPSAGPPPRAIWNRLRPVGTTCLEPPAEVLSRAFPAFSKLPDQPGYLSWSMTGYDIDAAGKPVNVRTIAGSGTAALDVASRDAVSRSRFSAEARTGCLWPYFKGPTILAAPQPPEEDGMRPKDATCPRPHDWARKPVLRYPQGYQRRNIEGWAMVAYDVAPWGETGNIRVLAAEPAAEFGDAATAMIRDASLPPSPAGYTGCVDRVRYVIQKPGALVGNAVDAD